MQKYLNNPRNIQTEISNKKTFIDLNNFLNKKIIYKLFDYNLISNSKLNEDKKDKLLLKEERNLIDEIINKFETKNINKNINGVKQNENYFYENDIKKENYLIINNKQNINASGLVIPQIKVIALSVVQTIFVKVVKQK